MVVGSWQLRIARQGRRSTAVLQSRRLVHERTDARIGVLQVGAGVTLECERLVPVEIDTLAAFAEFLERSGLCHRRKRVGRVREVRIATARNLVVSEAARHRVVARELRRGDILARLQKRRSRRELRVKEGGEAHGSIVVAKPRAAAARFRDIEAAVVALRAKDELRRLLLRLGDRLARVSAAAERPEGKRRQGRHLRV